MSKLSEIIKVPVVMNTLYTNESFTMDNPHAHKNGVEINYVVSGYMEMDFYPNAKGKDGPFYPEARGKDSEPKRISVSSGQFILITSGMPHLMFVPEKVHILVIELDMYPDGISFKDFILSSSFAKNCKPVISLFRSLNDILLFRDNNKINIVLSDFLKLLYDNHRKQQNEYYEFEFEILLKELLVQICMCSQLIYSETKFNRYITQTMAYISGHYNKNFSPADLSRLLGISIRQLNNYLNEAMGQSLSQLLMKIRLENAKNLLEKTNYGINSIALSVGYSNLRVFECAFKKNYSYSPKEYRQKVENQGFRFWADPTNMSRIMLDTQMQLHADKNLPQSLIRPKKKKPAH